MEIQTFEIWRKMSYGDKGSRSKCNISAAMEPTQFYTILKLESSATTFILCLLYFKGKIKMFTFFLTWIMDLIFLKALYLTPTW